MYIQPQYSCINSFSVFHLRTQFIKGKHGVINTWDSGQWKDTNQYIKPVAARTRTEAANSQFSAIEK